MYVCIFVCVCARRYVGTHACMYVCTYEFVQLERPVQALCVCYTSCTYVSELCLSPLSLSLSILSGWDRFCQHGGHRMTVVPEGCRLDQRRHGGRFRPQAGRKTIAHRTDSHEC